MLKSKKEKKMRGKVRMFKNNCTAPLRKVFGLCRMLDKRCVFWDGECLAPYPSACPFEPGPIDDEYSGI